MNKPVDVTLVTYRGFPALTEDDQLLADRLRRIGLRVAAGVWDDPRIDWSATRVAVIRSTWDYFEAVEKFRVWLGRASRQTVVLNRPDTVLWNLDKRYLADLGRRGVPIVPSLFQTGGDGDNLIDSARGRAWTDVVIKPTIAASSSGARRFDTIREEAAARNHAQALQRGGGAIVQPYFPVIETEGERSLIFISGEYSHAVRKAPFSPGVIGGEAKETDHSASPAEIDFGRRALAASGHDPLYARIDLIPTADGPLLMELELIEPFLFFARRPESAMEMAMAIAALPVFSAQARPSPERPAAMARRGSLPGEGAAP